MSIIGPATLQVWVGDMVVCIKIAGRASFHCSVEFKTLVTTLWQQGQTRFILDLSDCQLMDSTFLGVMAGLGIKLNAERNGNGQASLELWHASSRVADLIENLGISHLFKTVSAPSAPATADCNRVDPAGLPTGTPADKNEISRTCLEAHRLLMELNPNNVPKFKDVTRFLEEDLKRQGGSNPAPGRGTG